MKYAVKLSFFLLFINNTHAEIITDSPTGLQPTVDSLGNITIPQNIGITKGNNLFHSFQKFNINTGETATFTGNNNLKNVISRVTGGKISIINGLLKSKIPNANFYFINPAGINFSENAIIDVPAAFHASTADNIKFSDNIIWNTNDTSTNNLSIGEPVSFGFINNQTGDISVKNNEKFNFTKANDVSLSADNIIIENSQINNLSGNLKLSAIGNTATNLPINGIANQPLTGHLKLNNSLLEITNESTKDASNKNIIIEAGKINIDGAKNIYGFSSAIVANTYDLGDAGNIIIKADEMISKNALISSGATKNGGDAGNILIDTNKANLSGKINTDAYGLSNAGNMTINSSEMLLDGRFHVNSYSSGHAGDLIINTNDLAVSNNSIISSGSTENANAGHVKIYSNHAKLAGDINADAYGSGNAGNVIIDSSKILLNGKIHTNARGSGNAGQLSLKSNDLTVLDNSLISSGADILAKNAGFVTLESNKALLSGIINANTYGTGDAGLIKIKVKDLTTTNKSIISSGTAGSGDAGTIMIDTEKATLAGNINTKTFSSGNAGNIDIKANDLFLKKAGFANILTQDIKVDNILMGEISSNTSDKSSGNSGKITIDSNNMWVNGEISTSTAGSGHAGNVLVNAAYLNVADGGKISSSTAGSNASGYAGVVNINSNALLLDNGSILSSTDNTGWAGDIQINVSNLIANNNSHIDTSTTASGDAGHIKINARDLYLNTGSYIISDTMGSGHAGTVNLNANNTVLDNALVSSKTASSGRAGNIEIKSDAMFLMRNNASVSTATTGSGSAGDINVFSALVGLDNASISAEASEQSQGQTGDIKITADKAVFVNSNVSLKNNATVANPTSSLPSSINVFASDINLVNSKITTESTGNVDAGDIHINFSHWLQLDPSFITTTANIGNGGDININGGELIYLKDSGFLTSVSGANGNGGNIKVNADYLIMDTGVIQANAVGGKGGNIDLNLRYALIPSHNSLILGGKQVSWLPFSGLNVIQAASETGVNGVINQTTPQFDISASISGLDAEHFVIPTIDVNPCDSASSWHAGLARLGYGGIPSNESKDGFIPPTSTVNAEMVKQNNGYVEDVSPCKN